MVQLQDFESGKVLGSASMPFDGARAEWTWLNFTITPTASTVCVDGSKDPAVLCGRMGPEAGHICVKCGGQIVVGLSAPGKVNIDYVFLQPGPWGRFADLPVLKSGVEILKEMGVTAIRQGGSFTDPADYYWKLWRGKPWDRPSLGWKVSAADTSSFNAFLRTSNGWIGRDMITAAAVGCITRIRLGTLSIHRCVVCILDQRGQRW